MKIKLMSLLVTLSAGIVVTRLLAEDLVLEGPPDRATLVELYSSEGCSSCPPAEQWISQFNGDSRLWKQIVPVVFHVDYWDGQGWPDRFARKSYTQRQSDYQARWNATTVYTPEFIVDGREWHRSLLGGPLPLAKPGKTGALKLVIHCDNWGVKVAHPSPGAASVRVNVAWLGMNIETNVRGGENGGRKLTHDFVVLDFQSKPAAVSGANGIVAEFPAPTLGQDRPGAIAAWLSADDGSILQAAGGSLR